MALDDSPSDFDFVTLALSANDADGFTMSETDLTTSRGTNEALQLIAAGAGGHFAGIATADAANNGDGANQQQDEDDERTYAYMLAEASNQLLSTIEETQRRIVRELVEQAIARAERINAMADHAIEIALQDLTDGKITQTQFAQIEHTMGEVKAEVHSLRSEVRELDRQAATQLDTALSSFKAAIIATGSATAEQSTQAIDAFIRLDRTIVNIQVTDPQSGLPIKAAVFRGEAEGSYYYVSPETGERVDLDPTNPDHESYINVIKAQEKIGRFFGNDEEAGNGAQELRTLQQAFIQHITSRGLTEDYRFAFNELHNYTKTTLHISLRDQELAEIEDELTRYENNYAALIEQGVDVQSAIDRLRTRRAEIATEFAGYKDALEDNFAQLQYSFKNIMETLNKNISTTRVSLDVQRQNGIADRDDQIRARFPDEWKPPGQWAIWSWTANLVASAELKEAWKNVVTYQGKDVYRDNETLRLYTYDEESGTRTYINDPAVEAELNLQAYGTPNADGSPSTNFKFFKNETPDSKDPNNGLRESYIANTSHERVRERTDDIERRGQEKYGTETPTSDTGHIAEEAKVSLKFGFDRSADFISNPIAATVNFARSGFQTGLDMTQAFSGTATETQVAAADTPAPTDGNEISTDPTLKTTV